MLGNATSIPVQSIENCLLGSNVETFAAPVPTTHKMDQRLRTTYHSANCHSVPSVATDALRAISRKKVNFCHTSDAMSSKGVNTCAMCSTYIRVCAKVLLGNILRRDGST